MRINTIRRSLWLAIFLTAGVGGQAYAQKVVDVKIPFDFQVKGRTLPAGSYVVTMDAGDPGVVELRGNQQHSISCAMTIPASGRDPAGDTPSLVFTHHENTYALSQVWIAKTQGRELAKGWKG